MNAFYRSENALGCYTVCMATKQAKSSATPKVDELSSGAGDLSRIAWEAPAFAYYDKSWLWIAGVVTVGVILLGVFIYLRDYSAMAVVVVGTLVFLQQSRKKPEQLQYVIDQAGVTVGTTTYPWSALKSFWLVTDVSGGHLYLETTNRLLPTRTIHLANVEPAEVRARLAQRLPERTTQGEELADRLLRILRF